MKVSTYPEVTLPSQSRPVVTLGNFDGVHLGHQSIMKELRARSQTLDAPSMVVTFEPHPISVLRPEAAPQRIQTPEQKQETLARIGIEELVVVPFTPKFSRLEPQEFVRAVIVDKLRAAELVLGHNFRFGHGRVGDLNTLRSFGHKYGFVVHEVSAATAGEEMISSSRIRRELGDGEVGRAAFMLGRAYFVDGRVIKGDGRGRLIGFHTANLELTGSLLAKDGVYVTSVRVGDEVHQGMSHVGRRPTFGLDSRTVETHLFGFSEEIYGEWLRLYFLERIRGTVRFGGPEELKQQLDSDREQALGFFRDRGRNLVL